MLFQRSGASSLPTLEVRVMMPTCYPIIEYLDLGKINCSTGLGKYMVIEYLDP